MFSSKVFRKFKNLLLARYMGKSSHCIIVSTINNKFCSRLVENANNIVVHE